MEKSLLWIGRIGLLLTIIPAVLMLFGTLALPTVKVTMVIGMVIWFVATPLKMKIAAKD